MKALIATHDFGHPVTVLALIGIKRRGVSGVAEPAIVNIGRHAWLARNDAIADSIAKHGLRCPIPVLAEGGNLWMAGGGSRMLHAIRHGYTHISAIVLEDAEALRALAIEMGKQEPDLLPPEHVHRWWEGWAASAV